MIDSPPVSPSALYAHRRGAGDPSFRVAPDGAVWRASFTPSGPGALRVSPSGAVSGAGPGGSWLVASAPGLLGALDDPSPLPPLLRDDLPGAAVLRDALRRYPDLRLGRSGLVFEALVPAVLEQKVVGREAWRAWRYLVRRFGTPVPDGPAGLVVPPPADVWARIPSWEWHRSGAEPVRARTIVTAARAASRLEAAGSSAELDRMLRSLPGIGVWTSAEVRQRVFGDPDALSVGDYHLPGIVGFALTGAKTDDAGMLALLEPYAGQRHRVARLVGMAGPRPPRRGPRLALRDYRAF